MTTELKGIFVYMESQNDRWPIMELYIFGDEKKNTSIWSSFIHCADAEELSYDNGGSQNQSSEREG